MSFVVNAPGTETLELSPNGIYASQFKTESAMGGYYAASSGEQVVGLAFVYPPRGNNPGKAHFFVLFKGSTRDLCDFMAEQYEFFHPEYKSALEFTRSVMAEQRCEYFAKLSIDYDHVIPNTESWRATTKEMRDEIRGHLKKHVYDKVGKSKERFINEDLRFFQCHRVLNDKEMKVSYHAHSRSIVFQNWDLMSEVMMSIPSLDHLDMSIYRPSRKLRLPGSWKSSLGDLVFKPVDDQVTTSQPSDAWATVLGDGVEIMTKEDVMEKFPNVKKCINSTMTHRLPLKKPRLYNAIGDDANEILNKRYHQPESHHFMVLAGGSTVKIQSSSSGFCFRRPSYFHDHVQSTILVDVQPRDNVIRFTETCFGTNCSSLPLSMGTPSDLGILAVEVLRWPDLEFIGQSFDDEYVLQFLPDGPWRYVYYEKVSGPTRFLISNDYLVCIHYPDFQILDRKSFEFMEMDTDARKVIVSLLFRDVYYEIECVFTVPGECTVDTKQIKICQVMKDFFDMMMRVRGMRMDNMGNVFQRHSSVSFLYEPIQLERHQSYSKRLIRWILNEIKISNHVVMQPMPSTGLLARTSMNGSRIELASCSHR